MQTKNQVYFNIIANMPAKLKELKYISFKYQLVKTSKGVPEPYILVHDDSGFLVQFSMAKIFEDNKIDVKIEEGGFKAMFKDTQTIINEDIAVTTIELNQKNRIRKTYEEIGLLKAHEKPIAIALKVHLELLVTLTISVDGYIRLWNQ